MTYCAKLQLTQSKKWTYFLRGKEGRNRGTVSTRGVHRFSRHWQINSCWIEYLLILAELLKFIKILTFFFGPVIKSQKIYSVLIINGIRHSGTYSTLGGECEADLFDQ